MTDSNATSTSGANEDYQVRVAELERQNRGLIKDLQGEREKKHNLEDRLTAIEQNLSSAGQPQPDVDPNAKVNLLAQDPDGYIAGIVKKAVKPIEEGFQQDMRTRQFERAYTWVAKQEGKDPEDIQGSDMDKEFVRIAKDHGMTFANPVSEIKAVYKIYKQEQKEKEASESKRSETITGMASERAKSPKRVSQKTYSREEIMNMDRDTYEKNREAILEAEKQGLIS